MRLPRVQFTIGQFMILRTVFGLLLGIAAWARWDMIVLRSWIADFTAWAVLIVPGIAVLLLLWIRDPSVRRC